MMVDRYTKFILTVIAVALVALLMRPLFEVNRVDAQVAGCGVSAPCFVQVVGGPVPVSVVNDILRVRQ